MAEQSEESVLRMTDEERGQRYGRNKTALRGLNREYFDDYIRGASSRELLDLLNYLCGCMTTAGRTQPKKKGGAV